MLVPDFPWFLIRGLAGDQPRKHGYELLRNVIQQLLMVATTAAFATRQNRRPGRLMFRQFQDRAGFRRDAVHAHVLAKRSSSSAMCWSVCLARREKMEANAPLPHQAAFATEDALFIPCK